MTIRQYFINIISANLLLLLANYYVDAQALQQSNEEIEYNKNVKESMNDLSNQSKLISCLSGSFQLRLFELKCIIHLYSLYSRWVFVSKE